MCTEYNGLDQPCNQGITVTNLNDTLLCDYYVYSGECHVDE